VSERREVMEAEIQRRLDDTPTTPLSRRFKSSIASPSRVDLDNATTLPPARLIRRIFTHREMCSLKGCSLGLRDEKDRVRLLAATSRGHRTAVSQTTCNIVRMHEFRVRIRSRGIDLLSRQIYKLREYL